MMYFKKHTNSNIELFPSSLSTPKEKLVSLKLQEFSIEENFLTFLNQEHFFLLKSIWTDTVQ